MSDRGGAVRVAALDIGTNTVRLLVADAGPGDALVERDRRIAITRLGQGVDAAGRLAPEAVERTLAAVRAFAAAARALGPDASLATGTSAVREAEDGGAFMARVAAESGFATRVLAGEEEGATTFRGVASGGAPPGRVVVIDVGGGSTELTVAEHGRVLEAVSVRAGSVRTTERWLGEGVVEPARLAGARSALDELLLAEIPDALLDGVDGAVAVAGTATTLAALDLRLDVYDPARVHGHRLALGAIEGLASRLAALDLPARRALPGIEPDRAPVLVGGAAALAAALARTGQPAATVSERDILHGIALLAADGARAS